MISSINRVTLIETKSGKLSLKVDNMDGGSRTLHSLYDPEAEARKIAGAFEFDGKGILVVLGLGLGYHVAELAGRFPHAGIIVIEADPNICELAKEHGPDLDSRILIIAGLTPGEALRRVTEYQMKRGLAPLALFALGSAVSAFENYYSPIVESLNRTVSVKLWDRLRYSKFKQDKQKVLLIDTGYFLVREAEKALKALGHDVLRAPVEKRGKGEIVISSFVDAIVNFKPDFLLTMNHLGFDEDGVLTDFFRSIGMPVASWYVDSPNLIVQAFDKNVSPWTSLFLWDKSYMKDMESMGFDSVLTLPLATDESLFKPLKAGKHRKMLNEYTCDVGFVGNSMVDPVNDWMAKVDPVFHAMIEKSAEHLALPGNRHGDIMSAVPEMERERLERLTNKERRNFEAAVIWKATLLYRLSLIKTLEKYDTRIFGDQGWRLILHDSSIRLGQPLDYYKELPSFYNACKINFNATSRQMKEAVNQRVFDVPACGSFILTDYQESLEGLFEVGKEIIVYKSRDEIPELVKFYLDNPGERKAVAERGRERVLKEHTYKHRLQMIIDKMKGRYS
jgi:spore maturation protein CgeB